MMYRLIVITSSITCLLVAVLHTASGQPLHMSPSFHRISYSVGPDGRSSMGGYGDELEPFFRGLGTRGRRFGGAIAGMWVRPRPFFRRPMFLGR